MASFYETRARLLASHGDWKGAREAMDDAISRESIDRWDYSLRVGQYQERRVTFLVDEAKNDIQVTRDEFERSRARLVETLGLLAALVALVVAGASTAVAEGGRSAEDSVRVLVALGGVLIVSVAAYSLLLGGSKDWIRGAAASALGAGVVAAAWFV